MQHGTAHVDIALTGEVIHCNHDNLDTHTQCSACVCEVRPADCQATTERSITYLLSSCEIKVECAGL